MGKLFGDMDRPLFLVTLAVVVATIIIGIAMPEQFTAGLNALQAGITANFGWWYMLCIAACIFFLFWCAFSKYGKLKLGKDDDKPEYSSFSWFAMLFSCGIGVGFIFWGVAEPMYHFMQPPPYSPYEAGAPEAAPFAMQIALLHWGIHGWVGYAAAGLPIAYFAFRKNRPMTVANALYGLIGDRVNGIWGKVIDFLAAFATICGISTSLGMGLMSLSFALNKLFGIEINTTVLVIIDLVIVAGFIASATSGIARGIKHLSNINMVMAFCVLGFLLAFGPTRYQLNLMTESLGNYLQNFIFMTFYTGTADKSGWIGWWTVFYWAWWIAWGPFVGGFVARISKGRTIREYVIGVLLMPFALTLIWFNVIGGTALNYQINGIAKIWESIQVNAGSGFFVMTDVLPMGTLIAFVVLINLFIFIVTSADSASYYVAMLMTKGDLDPTISMRGLWGFCIGIVSVILLITGGLAAVQTASIIAALPFSIVIFLMIFSVIKGFQSEGIGPSVNTVETIVPSQTSQM